jgi:hypothetical protein
MNFDDQKIYGSVGGYSNQTAGTATKPPLGLTPRYVIRIQRIFAILGAIYRYTDANLVVPVEWTEELSQLITDHNRTITYETKYKTQTPVGTAIS